MRFLLQVVLLPLLLGLATLVILLTTAWTSLTGHLDEATQRTLGPLAGQVAALDEPTILNAYGELDPAAANHALTWLSAASPNVDFYILDLRGRIVAPDPRTADLEITAISMPPVRRFLDSQQIGESQGVLLGEDPKDRSAAKIFSAALLPKIGEPAGYLYAVLENPLRAAATGELRQELLSELSLWALSAVLVLVIILLSQLYFRLYRPLIRLGEDLIGSLGDESPKLPRTDSEQPVADLEDGVSILLNRLDRQEKQVESLTRVRREVLANFTHDLRTPIATVRGYLETLALSDRALSQQQRQDYLKIALRHSERLSRLVDELLELSRLDRCEVAPRLERFRLGELVQDNIQRFRLRSQQGNIRLDADFDPDMPPVFADVALMERALENLIENALRHSKAGDHISIRLRHGDRRLLVSVIDSGSGIAAEDLPFIFDRFYRSREQPKHGEARQGVGLGLAITRRIAELHGGQLLVESALGEGSIFTFSLEVAPLTFQLSTADQLRFRPSRWPPRPAKDRSAELHAESGPIG